MVGGERQSSISPVSRGHRTMVPLPTISLLFSSSLSVCLYHVCMYASLSFRVNPYYWRVDPFLGTRVGIIGFMKRGFWDETIEALRSLPFFSSFLRYCSLVLFSFFPSIGLSGYGLQHGCGYSRWKGKEVRRLSPGRIQARANRPKSTDVM